MSDYRCSMCKEEIMDALGHLICKHTANGDVFFLAEENSKLKSQLAAKSEEIKRLEKISNLHSEASIAFEKAYLLADEEIASLQSQLTELGHNPKGFQEECKAVIKALRQTIKDQELELAEAQKKLLASEAACAAWDLDFGRMICGTYDEKGDRIPNGNKRARDIVKQRGSEIVEALRKDKDAWLSVASQSATAGIDAGHDGIHAVAIEAISRLENLGV